MYRESLLTNEYSHIISQAESATGLTEIKVLFEYLNIILVPNRTSNQTIKACLLIIRIKQSVDCHFAGIIGNPINFKQL
jgi:hypothetical protein